MPDPKSLKIGDWVRFVAYPDEWANADYHVPHYTRSFIKKMIRRRRPLQICELDRDGYPVVYAKTRYRRKIHSHWYSIYELSGWRKVNRRAPP